MALLLGFGSGKISTSAKAPRELRQKNLQRLTPRVQVVFFLGGQVSGRVLFEKRHFVWVFQEKHDDDDY